MTIKSTLLAATTALAAYVAAPALAQSAADASIGNLNYHLIDLDPNDGVAPWINVSSASAVGESYLNSVGDISFLFARAALYDFGTADYEVANGTALIRIEPAIASASMEAYNAQGYANAEHWLSFTLSPHTQVVFSSGVDLSAAFSDPGTSDASASLYGRFTDAPVGALAFGSSLLIDEGEVHTSLSAAANNTFATSLSGYIVRQAHVDVRAISPVPEPAPAGMLAGGLLLVGALLRRRSSTRKNHMNSKSTLLAACLAAFAACAAAPALAQSTASASLGSLGYRLIDLDPNDGIMPWISLLPDSYATGESRMYGPDIPGQVTEELAVANLYTFGKAGYDVANGKARMRVEPDRLNASIEVLNGQGYILTEHQLSFTLSPHTQVVFSTSADLSSALFDLGSSQASANLYGWFTDVPDGSLSFSSSLSISQGEIHTILSAAGNNTFAAPMSGYIDLQANVSVQSISAVPEPAPAGMLAGGLALLLSGAGARTRGRARARIQALRAPG